MREIKFRVWDSVHNKMLIVDEIRLNNPSGNSHIFVRGRGWIDACQEVLMQYTGLKDKNGKEIYEGDILQKKLYGGLLSAKEVGWIEDSCCFGLVPAKPYAFSDFTTEKAGCHEVIGNIYENPKLLKHLTLYVDMR